MNEWMNELMNELMNEWMNQWKYRTLGAFESSCKSGVCKNFINQLLWNSSQVEYSKHPIFYAYLAAFIWDQIIMLLSKFLSYFDTSIFWVVGILRNWRLPRIPCFDLQILVSCSQQRVFTQANFEWYSRSYRSTEVIFSIHLKLF